MKALLHIPCPLCNSTEGFFRIYSDNPSEIVRCSRCDLVFFNPQPSQEYLAEFYSSQSGYMPSIEDNLRSFQRDPTAWKAIADFILAKVYRYLPEAKGQRILDVGCAYGFFLQFAKERGLDGYGVEVSQETSQYAKGQGLSLRTGTLLEAAFDDNFFDIVTLNNVLEHTLNPVVELREVFRILKNQGIVFLAVPNFGSLVAKADNFYWKMKSWPNHLFYFTESTLIAILHKAGFSVLEVFTHQGESDYGDDVRVIRDRLMISTDEEVNEIIRLLWKMGKGQELVVLAKKDKNSAQLAPGTKANIEMTEKAHLYGTSTAKRTSNESSNRGTENNQESSESDAVNAVQACTALFIATSGPGVVDKVFSRANLDFPLLQFTVVAPSSYRSLFPSTVHFISNEELKTAVWTLTRRLRRSRFDLTILALDGLPIFRRAKIWAFLTHYRNLWIYNENGDRTLFRVSSIASWRRLFQEIRITRDRTAAPTLEKEKWSSPASSPNSPLVDDYTRKVAKERQHYTDLHVDSATLTEPANPALTYLLDHFQHKVRERIGIDVWGYVIAAVNRRPGCQVLSLGSGPCGAEIMLAQSFDRGYTFDCIDINPDLLAKGKERAQSLGLSFRFVSHDINLLSLPKHSYDIIFAHAALHHFLALEHVFEQVKQALRPGGEFILYEVIPRNGMLMWPETNDVVQRLWKLLPDRLKYEHPQNPPEFRAERPNRDSSVDGFECIRSQDIYPLLKDTFRTKIEIFGYVFARRFLDNDFGPNYDLSRPEDRALINLILELDQVYLTQGLLKPESVFMVLEK